MIERIRKYKKVNYCIMLVLTLIQIGTFIWFSCVLSFLSIYIHITNWSFLLSTIYLILAIICDTSKIVFSSEKLEKLNYYTRNSFSKIAYPFNFMITMGFWGILLIGLIFSVETFTKEGAKISTFRIICNLHLHLGITIIMFAELFLVERIEMKLSLGTGITNLIIFLAYIIMVCIAKYIYNENAYVFMKNLNIWAMVGIGIAIFVVLVGSFFIYKVISNCINSQYIKNIKNRKELPEEEVIDDNDDNDDSSLK